jgi:spermidine synthase
VFAYQLEQEMVPLAIAIPFLGFGFAAALLHIFDQRIQQSGPDIWRKLALSSALFFGCCAILSLGLAGQFSIDVEGDGSWLLLYITLMTVPFFFAGVTIALLLKNAGTAAGYIYGADLAAATVACVLVVLLLPPLGGLGLAFGAASIGALGAFPLTRHPMERAVAGTTFLLCLTAAGIQLLFAPLDITPAPRKWVHDPSEASEVSIWDPVARLDVSKPLSVPPGFGGVLSLNVATYIDARVIYVDGRAPTFLLKDPFKDGNPEWASAMVQAAPYQVHPNAKVAVIGVGGGPDLVIARANGAREITGIEINRSTLKIGALFADYTGHLLEQDNVEIVRSEGRTYFSATDSTFDVIQLSGVDTWSTVVNGANATVESYLYTVEGIETLASRLKPGGVLGFSRWNLFPPKETLRMVTTFREVLERRGIENPAEHIVVISGGTTDFSWAESMLKLEPFTEKELSDLSRWAHSLGFEIQHPSDGNILSKFLRDPDPDSFVNSYPYAVHPVTDDRPFFFSFVRSSDLFNAAYLVRPDEGKDKETLDSRFAFKGASNVAVRFAFLTIGVVSMLSLLLLLIPGGVELYRRRRSPPTRTSQLSLGAFVFLYIGLAFGFIFFEIGFLQRSSILLGGPLYSLGVVLATLLLATGAGSFLSDRLEANCKTLARVALGSAAAVASVWLFFQLGGHRWLLPLPWWLRLVSAIGLLLPCGLILGTVFPLSLRIIHGAEEDKHIPWAWGINASFTAMGASLCLVLAMGVGFSGVMGLGVAAYLIAALAAQRFLAHDDLPRQSS